MGTFGIIFLSATSGDYETGLFSAAFKLLSFCLIPTIIIQTAFSPSISRAATLEEKKQSIAKYSKIIALLGSAIATTFSFFPDVFTVIVYGDKYTDSITILRVLMFNCFIVYYNTSIAPILFLWKLEKKSIYAYTISVISCIGLNILLIPHWNGIGAAFATLGADITLAIALSYFFFKEIHRLYLFDFLKLIGLGLLSGFIGKSVLSLADLQNVYFQFIGIAITLISLSFFVLKFRIVELDEIKKIFKKDATVAE